jgi:DNA-binding MarR family transcriptional regulator
VWDAVQEREAPVGLPAGTVKTVASRDERHTAGHTKAAGQRLGKWERHLLLQADESETAAGKKGVKRYWAPVLLKPLSEGLKDPWTSAARAVRSLEAKGLVAVEPVFDPDTPKQRLVIRYYRLTPQGRRAVTNMKKRPEVAGPKVQALRTSLRASWKQEEDAWDAMLADRDFLPKLRAQLEARGEPADDDLVHRAALAMHNFLQTLLNQRTLGRRGLERVLAYFDPLPDTDDLDANVD